MKKSPRKKVKPIKFRQTLFWDVNPKKIHPDKHARYVIERILDLGDEAEVSWMGRYYPPRLIRDAVRSSRVLHDKSRALWSLIYR